MCGANELTISIIKVCKLIKATAAQALARAGGPIDHTHVRDEAAGERQTDDCHCTQHAGESRLIVAAAEGNYSRQSKLPSNQPTRPGQNSDHQPDQTAIINRTKHRRTLCNGRSPLRTNILLGHRQLQTRLCLHKLSESGRDSMETV